MFLRRTNEMQSIEYKRRLSNNNNPFATALYFTYRNHVIVARGCKSNNFFHLPEKTAHRERLVLIGVVHNI